MKVISSLTALSLMTMSVVTTPIALGHTIQASNLETVIEGLLYYPYEGDIVGGTANCNYGSSSMDVNFSDITDEGKIKEALLSDATSSYAMTGKVKKKKGESKYIVKLNGEQEYSTFTRTVSFKGTVAKKSVNKIKNVKVDIYVDYKKSDDCEYHINIDKMIGIE